MLDRIRNGWTFIRIIYLIFGGFIIAQSFIDKQWIGFALGIYFTAMGLFGFGCASGNCFDRPNPREQEFHSAKFNKDIQYEEIHKKQT
ncbi:MAG: hypothetical protein JNL65_06045 [Saprospiraceae bacterium]|nr:hypothetical protein [Saprospiraceae bacterium]HRG69286.1 hypothetical protein [Saprospiraceae bacterium]